MVTNNRFGGDGEFPNRHERRAHKNADGPGPDDVVQLTGKGRAMLDMILEAASNEAGRTIGPDDLLQIIRRVREETGIQDFDLHNPIVADAFKRQLHANNPEA